MNTFLWTVAQVSECRMQIVTLKRGRRVAFWQNGSHFLPIPFSATIISRLYQLRASAPDGFEKLWAHNCEGHISILIKSVFMLMTCRNFGVCTSRQSVPTLVIYRPRGVAWTVTGSRERLACFGFVEPPTCCFFCFFFFVHARKVTPN